MISCLLICIGCSSFAREQAHFSRGKFSSPSLTFPRSLVAPPAKIFFQLAQVGWLHTGSFLARS